MTADAGRDNANRTTQIPFLEFLGAYILNYTTNENTVPILEAVRASKQNGIPEAATLRNSVLIATADCVLVGIGVFVQSSYSRRFLV